MSDPSEKMALTIVDTTGIQAYIFGTNTLRHHMGASWLVDWATQDAVHKTVLELRDDIQANIDTNGKIDPDKRIEDSQQKLDVELLYSGGGNAVLIFRKMTEAHTFTQQLTRKILEDAPGLQLVVTHICLDWEHDILANKFSELRKAANQKKHERYPSMPLLGLGVTADCQFTDLPAEREVKDIDGNLLRVSGEVQAKLDHFDDARQRLYEEVQSVLRPDLDFVYDFDQIGDKGESSFLAVVHIDGNDMGTRFAAIARKHAAVENNRAYICAIRRLSARVKEISRNALRQTVEELQNAIHKHDPGKGRIGGKVPLSRKGKELRLPFRPIVYGGDDVTFVCDGRLGLTLAAHYLEAMQQSLPLVQDENTSDENASLAKSHDTLFVRAGVAVVNNHYPFSRAYALAEELAQSAKEKIQKYSKDKLVSALDWHFAVNGLAMELDTLRDRDYETADGSLLLRPLLLIEQPTPEHWQTWPFFKRLMGNFLDKPEWVNSRNKLIGYGEALRSGPNAAKQFRAALKRDAYLEVPFGDETAKACGWYKECAVHYDAVEAFDFFVRLQPDAAEGTITNAQSTGQGRQS